MMFDYPFWGIPIYGTPHMLLFQLATILFAGYCKAREHEQRFQVINSLKL